MKRIIVVLISIALLTACSSSHVNPDYAAYTETMKAFAAREQQPLMDLQLWPDGRIKGIKMNQQAQIPNIQQARPSPWFALGAKALGVAGTFGAIWAVGHSMENIIDSVNSSQGGNINIGDNNSWSAGKDVNASYGGGISVNGNTTYSSPFNDYSEPCCGESITGTGTSTSTDIFE